MSLIQYILEKKYSQAEDIIKEQLDEKITLLREEYKKIIAARLSEMDISGMRPSQNLEVAPKETFKDMMRTHHWIQQRKHSMRSREDGLPHKSLMTHTERDYRNRMKYGSPEQSTSLAKQAGIDGLQEDDEMLDEASRFKIVKARIRNGKIQRRRKVATADGYTFRGGKLKRMTVRERRNRRMSQRRAKIKRKAKLNRTLRKRKLSLIKRKRLGV